MRLFSAATGTTALTLVRAARTGTTPRRTRTTTSGRASPVPTQDHRFALTKVVQAVQHRVVSQIVLLRGIHFWIGHNAE